MDDPGTWFWVIVSTSTLTAIINNFIQRFVVRPVDRKITELIEAVKQLQNSNKEEITEIEKEVLKLRNKK